MVFVLTTLGVSALLTEVGVPPDVLAARNSSLLLETLPDFVPVCEDPDKLLESGMSLLCMGAWTLGTDTLEATDKPFLAINMIAWAWRKMVKDEQWDVCSSSYTQLVCSLCMQQNMRENTFSGVISSKTFTVPA